MNVSTSRWVDSLAFGLCAVMTYVMIYMLVPMVWNEPGFMLKPVGLKADFSWFSVVTSFLIASSWAYIGYASRGLNLKNYINRGGLIALKTSMTLILVISIVNPGAEGIVEFFGFCLVLFVFGGVTFGWLIVLNAFLVSYLLYKYNVKESGE